jgi:hypothetical protein
VAGYIRCAAEPIVHPPSAFLRRGSLHLNLPSLSILRGEEVCIGGRTLLIQIADPKSAIFQFVRNDPLCDATNVVLVTNPAEVFRRISPCDGPCCLRPKSEGSAFGLQYFRGYMGSLALRPGDSLTILFRWLRQ